MSCLVQISFENDFRSYKSISSYWSTYQKSIHSFQVLVKTSRKFYDSHLYISTDSCLFLAKAKAGERSKGCECQGMTRKQFFVKSFRREQTNANITFYLSCPQPLPFSDSSHVGNVQNKCGQSVKHHKVQEMLSFQSSVKTGQHQFLSSGTLNSRKETPGIKCWAASVHRQ